MTTTTYNINDHLAVLTPANGSRTKHHCPVCNGNDLDINRTTGAYKCFNGCLNKDIREALDRLEGKPEWTPPQDNWTKPVRPASRKDYFYPDREGKPLVKVQRIDPGDGTKKVFHQYHWKDDQWKKGNPDVVKKSITIYRYREIQEAIQAGKLIFWVEGESTADALWLIGIPATTTIGGSGAYHSYGNYKSDLEEGRIVLSPDRAADGIKYITCVGEDFAAQIEGYYLAGTQGLWVNPHQILPESIADKLEQISQARGVNSEPLTLGLLVAASSTCHANTRLEVSNYGDVLSVYPNLYAMNVGDSGSLKSPTNATSFAKPLRSLQKKYIEKYELELQAYEVKLKSWETTEKKERGKAPSIPRLVVVLAEDATMEKIEDLALHQPGICPGIYRDEVIGIFQAFDKHGGKGGNDSRAKLLSYYDGSPINIHRVGTGSKISKHDYHPVVFGGIQPEVLKGLAQSIGMDNDGTLCRFLYAPVNRKYKAWDENPDPEKIDTLVFDRLVENVHKLPPMVCCLDRDSQKVWARVVNHYNDECLNNPRLSAWLKHAYSKAIGQLGKLALTLHLIQCATTNTLSAVISATTIERAALALDYFISQAIALIATTEDTLEGHLVRILDKAKKLGSIAPRQVQTLFSGKKRINSSTARNYLQQLVDGGYGFLDGKGIFTIEELKTAPSASADNADKVLITYQQPEHTLDKGLNNIADNADNFNQSNSNSNAVKGNRQIEIDPIGLTSLASSLVMAAYQPESQAIKTVDELCSVWRGSDITKACEILRECNPVASEQIDKLLRQYQQRQC